MKPDSDSWETPMWLFEELNKEFNFAIDLCATKENSKCAYYCEDYLRGLIKETAAAKNSAYGSISYGFDSIVQKNMHGKEPFEIESAFMNPPYSNPKPFIEKAWEDSKYCKIVCLLPNTIKTCKYLDMLDENGGLGTFRKWKHGLEIRDLARRTGFNHPEKVSSSPSFGCMLLIMDRRLQ